MQSIYNKTQEIKTQLKTTNQIIKFKTMKTLTSLKTALVILLISFMSQNVNAQAYDFTLIQNSQFNYTIAAVSNFDSGAFAPFMQSYGFVLVFPDGVTISVDNYFSTDTDGMTTPIDGAALAGLDSNLIDYADNDLVLITASAPAITFNPHTVGAMIPLVTLTVIGDPVLGEIRVLDNESTLANSPLPAINGALDAFIQIDVIDDGTFAFTNEFNQLTGDVSFGFATLSIPTVELSAFSLYPNPASNYVNIKGSIIDLKKIDIFNINGQLVKTVTSNLDQIDISNLESAVYFVKLYSDTSSKTMKLVKR